MEQGAEQERRIEAFKEQYLEGIENTLMFLEMAPEDPLPADPSSMGAGDERTLDELSPQELEAAEKVLFERFGVDREAGLVRSYGSQAPEGTTVPGEVNITVFKTNEEEVFLQEAIYKDGAKRWLIGPDKNI